MAEPNLPETDANPAPPTAVAPPAPPKPVAPAKLVASAKKAVEPTRRNFLVSSGLTTVLALFGSWFAVAWTTFTLSMLGMVLGTVRFMFPNVLTEPPSSFKAGDWTNFEDNKVDDKFKEVGAWIIRGKDDSGRDIIYALSTTCTHLGCTPNWLESEKKFKCPCHGSGFKITGINFEGPAPRPLERYAIRRSEDGQIVVDKSRKFQKELEQWNDPDSYVLV